MQSSIEMGVLEDNIYFLNHSNLRDGPDNEWDKQVISDILSNFTLEHRIDTVRVCVPWCVLTMR